MANNNATLQYTPFGDAASVVLAPFKTFIEQTNDIALNLQPMVVLCLSILISVRAFQLLLSPSPQALLIDVFTKAARVVLCLGLASFVASNLSRLDGVIGEYQYSIAKIFLPKTDDSLIYQWKQEELLLTAIDSAVQPFLAKLHDAVKIANEQKKVSTANQDWLSLMVMGSAMVSSSASLAFAASVALMVLYFRIALTICLGLMPLFVIFLGFRGTSRMFHSWLGTTLSYIFAAGVAAVPVGMALTQLDEFGRAYALAIEASANGVTDPAKRMDFVTTPLLSLLTVGMMGYLAARLPTMVSRLVGGMVMGASAAEGGHLLGSAHQSLGQSMSKLTGGLRGATPARNSKGQFVSNRQSQSPLQSLSDGMDRAAQSALSAKNDWMAAHGIKPSGSTATSANRRPPQQTVADRLRATSGHRGPAKPASPVPTPAQGGVAKPR